MDTTEFIKDIPAEKIAAIFKDFFEQHMLVCDMLKGVDFVSINNVSIDEASIMYYINLDKSSVDGLAKILQSKPATLIIYGREFTPEIFINGNLLCITIKK